MIPNRSRSLIVSALAGIATLAAAGLAPAFAQPPGGPPGGPGGGPAARTVTVDCDRGESVQSALSAPAEELTVRIRGICHEDVVVARDRVTLEGRDPATDGLRGVSPSTDPPNAVLRIEGSHQVRVESLSIAEGARNGVEVLESQAVTLDGALVRDHGRDGVQTGYASGVTVTGTEIRDNGRAGLSGFHTGTLTCTGCTLAGSRVAVLGLFASSLAFGNSALDATENGVVAGLGSRVTLHDSTVSASGAEVALDAQSRGEIHATDSTLDGRVFAQSNSTLVLRRVDQESPSGFSSSVGIDSTLDAVDSSLGGHFQVGSFSKLVLDETSAGSIACIKGGDAWCSDPALISGSISGCSSCTTP